MSKMIVPGGASDYIDYRRGNGEPLSSKLDDIQWGFWGASNPGWTHENAAGQTWHADWIEYQTLDGKMWFSKAVAHKAPWTNQPSITFQHWPSGTDMTNPGQPDHEDANIKFLGWQGEHWCLLAWTEPAQTAGGTSNQVKFKVWGV